MVPLLFHLHTRCQERAQHLLKRSWGNQHKVIDRVPEAGMSDALLPIGSTFSNVFQHVQLELQHCVRFH